MEKKSGKTNKMTYIEDHIRKDFEKRCRESNVSYSVMSKIGFMVVFNYPIEYVFPDEEERNKILPMVPYFFHTEFKKSEKEKEVKLAAEIEDLRKQYPYYPQQLLKIWEHQRDFHKLYIRDIEDAYISLEYASTNIPEAYESLHGPENLDAAKLYIKTGLLELRKKYANEFLEWAQNVVPTSPQHEQFINQAIKETQELLRQ